MDFEKALCGRRGPVELRERPNGPWTAQVRDIFAGRGLRLACDSAAGVRTNERGPSFSRGAIELSDNSRRRSHDGA